METSEGNGGAQPLFGSPTKRAASDDQLTSSGSHQFKRSKSLAIKSLFVEKVRGVKEFSKQSLNKLGRHLSASDQSELAAAPRLLSVSSIDSEDTEDEPIQHRLVRTNAFKVCRRKERRKEQFFH